jgi:hypothetical protein
VSKPLATNSASKSKKYITASVEVAIFKKIRNKLKFVGANKAVLETGKSISGIQLFLL